MSGDRADLKADMSTVVPPSSGGAASLLSQNLSPSLGNPPDRFVQSDLYHFGVTRSDERFVEERVKLNSKNRQLLRSLLTRKTPSAVGRAPLDEFLNFTETDVSLSLDTGIAEAPQKPGRKRSRSSNFGTPSTASPRVVCVDASSDEDTTRGPSVFRTQPNSRSVRLESASSSPSDEPNVHPTSTPKIEEILHFQQEVHNSVSPKAPVVLRPAPEARNSPKVSPNDKSPDERSASDTIQFEKELRSRYATYPPPWFSTPQSSLNVIIDQEKNPNLVAVDFYTHLHNEILDFTDWVKPQPHEKDCIHRVICELEHVTKVLYPESTLLVFGSFFTHLLLPGGDLDLCLLNVEGTSTIGDPEGENNSHSKNPVAVLAELAIYLSVTDLAHAVELVGQAKVPILKFVHTKTGAQVDVCVNQESSITTSEFIKTNMTKYPAALPLVVLVKTVLAQRGLGETYTGGIGSYLLCCLVISFLQLHRTSTREEAFRTTSLGRLFVELLKYYSESFNLQMWAICVRGAGHLFPRYNDRTRVQNEKWLNHPHADRLVVQSPMAPEVEIGGPAFNFSQVRRVFKKIWTQLMTHKHKFDTSSPPPVPNRMQTLLDDIASCKTSKKQDSARKITAFPSARQVAANVDEASLLLDYLEDEDKGRLSPIDLREEYSHLPRKQKSVLAELFNMQAPEFIFRLRKEQTARLSPNKAYSKRNSDDKVNLPSSKSSSKKQSVVYSDSHGNRRYGIGGLGDAISEELLASVGEQLVNELPDPEVLAVWVPSVRAFNSAKKYSGVKDRPYIHRRRRDSRQDMRRDAHVPYNMNQPIVIPPPPNNMMHRFR